MLAKQSAATSAVQSRVLYVAIVASFMAFLDGSVVNLALPAIGRELGADWWSSNGSSTPIC